MDTLNSKSLLVSKSKIALYSLLFVLFSFIFSFFIALLAKEYIPDLVWDENIAIREKRSYVAFTLPKKFLYLFNNFDSNFYIKIAQKGYDTGSFEFATGMKDWAFYPLYPLLVRMFSFPFLDDIVAVFNTGLIISNALFVLSLFCIYLLLEEIVDDPFGYWLKVCFSILIFPSSFFLHLFYTESLFLFLSVLALLLIFRKKYFWASFVVSLAGLTRLVGILLFIPLVVHFLISARPINFKRFFQGIMYFLVSILGFVSFLVFMHYQTGDFLAPFKIQSSWNRGSSTSFFPFKYFFLFFSGLLRGNLITIDVLLSVLLLISALVLGLLLFKRISLQNKEQNYALALYNLAYVSIIAGSSSIDSVFRFVLVLFPFHLVMSSFMKKSPLFAFIVSFVFISLRTVLFILFISKIPGIGA